MRGDGPGAQTLNRLVVQRLCHLPGLSQELLDARHAYRELNSQFADRRPSPTALNNQPYVRLAHPILHAPRPWRPLRRHALALAPGLPRQHPVKLSDALIQ